MILYIVYVVHSPTLLCIAKSFCGLHTRLEQMFWILLFVHYKITQKSLQLKHSFSLCISSHTLVIYAYPDFCIVLYYYFWAGSTADVLKLYAMHAACTYVAMHSLLQ